MNNKCDKCKGNGKVIGQLSLFETCTACNGFGLDRFIVPIDTDTKAPCLYCGVVTTWQIEGENVCEGCTWKHQNVLRHDMFFAPTSIDKA